MNVVHLQQFPLLANYLLPFLRDKSRDFYSSSSRTNHFHRTRLSVGVDKMLKDYGSQLKTLKPLQLFNVENFFWKNEENQVPETNVHVNDDGANNSLVSNEIKKYVELQRRRKIRMANIGRRIPWNKGKKHRPETRELIKRRTTEALRNPKVRRKNSIRRLRVLSDEAKARIGVAQRKRWAVLLKYKRTQEKCYLTWLHSVAEAAKKGGQEQQGLEWSSYEKLKANIVLDYLQWKVKTDRAKLYAKLKAVDAEAVKRYMRVLKKEKARSCIINESKEESENGNVLSAFKHLKLNVKTTKWMLPTHAQETADDRETSVQKWDLEFIKQQKLRQRLLFADQIRATRTGQMISSPNEFQQ